MTARDHGEEGDAAAAASRDRLVLTTDRRVENGPLRLENPASRAGAETEDLGARPDASREAINAAPPEARTEDMTPSAYPASEPDEAWRETLSSIIREEVEAALEVQLDERVRIMVRREVARSLSARRRG